MTYEHWLTLGFVYLCVVYLAISYRGFVRYQSVRCSKPADVRGLTLTIGDVLGGLFWPAAFVWWLAACWQR